MEECIQFGHALWGILWHLNSTNPHLGPLYLSKIDIADGFYRVWVRASNVPNLRVLFSSQDEPAVLAPAPVLAPTPVLAPAVDADVTPNFAADVDAGVTLSVAAGATISATAKDKNNKQEMLEDECLIVNDSDADMSDDEYEMPDWV
jgi:hypothetical protein